MPIPITTISAQANNITYQVEVYKKSDASQLTARNAIYFFLGRRNINTNQYPVYYIGKTTQPLHSRLNGHHKWDEAEQKGFSYIGVTVLDSRQLSTAEEALIQTYQPSCNDILYDGE